MNTDDFFPSNFLKAADLPEGQMVPAVVESIESPEMPDGGRKPVLRFVSKTSGLVLNKTNCDFIEARHGKNMDAWVGQTITLYVTKTQFGGRTVPCIRVDIPVAPAAVAPGGAAQVVAPAPAPATAADIAAVADAGDDIPF